MVRTQPGRIGGGPFAVSADHDLRCGAWRRVETVISDHRPDRLFLATASRLLPRARWTGRGRQRTEAAAEAPGSRTRRTRSLPRSQV